MRIDPKTLKAWLHDGGEIALLDVREQGQFGEAHLFYAVPLPYSRLELEIERLVPRRATRVALCDDGASGVAERAARRLESLGYSDVFVLEGGTQGSAASGQRLFAGVNVPSKTFGELIEHECQTPRMTAVELRAMVERGEDVVVVDGRPFAEYRKMNIPGGVCCPNGELALRIGRIAPNPETKIVVNCAGRTRSIIGAQTLLNFGFPNPVYALENGTQGWFLAGFALEHGSERRYPGAPEGTELERLRERALGVAQRFAVPYVPALQVERWLSEENRTTYLLDVRSAEEFAAASLPGAQHAPGGQLVQATDQWIGVRGARLVLADGEGIRAVSAALWLRQMGHDASVLREGIRARLSHRPAAPRAALPAIPEADPNALGTARLIDLRPSMAYRKAHLRGAVWSIRPRLAQALGGSRGPLVLIAEQSEIAQLAAVDLEEMGVRDLRVLPAAKMDALALEATPESPTDCDCIDFLFFTHGRHEGNREAALQYLKWETDLVHQLDPAERASYRIIHEAIGQS